VNGTSPIPGATDTALRPLPIVFVVCATPLIYEALAESMSGLATLHEVPAGRPDLNGLLRAVSADAFVVDSPADAAELEALAQELQVPLLEVALRERKVRVLRDVWVEHEGVGNSAEEIRNLLIGAIYGQNGGR
jgi:hypothetical protein